jgi:tetratricopeptide (TPR) repeat protein
VRYVLEGSVRKAGNRVRITGQLIDTATSPHIWADRFDAALDDIFELQDQVASSVAGAIEPKLRQSEIDRASRKPTANLTAYDLYLRGLAQSYRYTDQGFAEAIVLSRQALAIDPSYAPAAAMVGWCRVLQQVQGWGALSADDIDEACLARQALEAERGDAETIWQAAYTLFFLAGEAAMAAASLDRALALNPNAAHAWLMRGNIHAGRNQPEVAIEAIERARRLSPFDPYTWFYAFTIALAHFAARSFEQAIEWADRTLHDQPRFVSPMRIKVAALAHLGHLDAARAELSRALAIDPKLTIAGYRTYAQFLVPEVLELNVTGLRGECSPRICDAYPAGQPIDSDGNFALPVDQRNPATRRAAVRVEADIAISGPSCFAGDGQQLDRHVGRELFCCRVADPIAVPGRIEIEFDRVVAQDRLRPGQAQPRRKLRGSRLEAEPAAPRRPVADDQN